MHLFNGEAVVISLDSYLSAENLILKTKYRHLFVYNTTDLNAVKMQNCGQYCVEYWGLFLIILPEDYSLQSLLWKDFYSCYGDLFESMIDVEHNVLCIKRLYEHIQKRIRVTEKTRILDFGCGSGLALNLDAECELIGYEPNEKMRVQAVKKGMKVLDAHQIYLVPDYDVDAVFASYVFHMGLDDSDVEILSRIVRPGGIVVANFYKDMNCRIVNNIFRRKGFFVKKIMEHDKGFGSIYEYYKK